VRGVLALGSAPRGVVAPALDLVGGGGCHAQTLGAASLAEVTRLGGPPSRRVFLDELVVPQGSRMGAPHAMGGGGVAMGRLRRRLGNVGSPNRRTTSAPQAQVA
jgi:hypothetical protein